MDVDDTLVLILERIDSPISLIRAASTCRRWRRLIADAGFLRRFHSRRGRTVAAGDYYNSDPDHDSWSKGRQGPSFIPSSSIDARHFFVDFVVYANIFPSPGPGYDQSWEVRDSRRGLLLMECFHWGYSSTRVFPDLVVCEPLTQQYKIIPQPPDFDAANCMLEQAFLLDVDEDEAGRRISMSNFRVLCVLLNRRDDGVAHTTVFTAGGDSDSMWSEKGIDHVASSLHSNSIEKIYKDDVLGSCYYYLPEDGTLITHDGSIGKFSLSMLPRAIKNCYDARIWTRDFAIINGGDGEPRIVIIMDHTMEVFARVDGAWAFENKVVLSKVACSLPGYQPSFFDKHLTILKRGVGFVVISPLLGRRNQWPFSVDLKTLEVAPAAKGTKEERDMGYQYELPWPPVLQVCVDR